MYACLLCGFVHEGRLTKERYDTKGGGRHYPTNPFHGYNFLRICPKCKSRVIVKAVED